MEKSKRPRILVLAHLPPPIHGVTVINEALVNSRFLRERFELDVIPMRFATEFSDIGTFRPRKFLAMLNVATRLAWHLVRQRPEAVYMTPTLTGTSFIRDAMFASVVKLFLVRIIYHLHGKGIREVYDSSFFYRVLYRWFFWDAQVVHLSERLSSDISGIVPKDRIRIVANGIPPPKLQTPARSKCSSSTPVLLYLSNIRRLKGVFVLLQALEILTDEGVALRARFAGAPGDPETMADFEKRCRESPATERIDYDGIVVGQEKDELFRTSDIFVMPTLFDAFPLVALEAMSYSLPVVCSAEGSLPDIVQDGETGLIVAKDDATMLAAALKALISNEDTRTRMGAAGQERFRTNFTSRHFEHHLADALDASLRYWNAQERI